MSNDDKGAARSRVRGKATSTETPSGGQEPAALLDENGQTLRFEDALGELEILVGRMEGGELTLEDSVACFERGMLLHQFCQQALAVADQKVQILIKRSEQVREGDLADFDAPNEASGNVDNG